MTTFLFFPRHIRLAAWHDARERSSILLHDVVVFLNIFQNFSKHALNVTPNADIIICVGDRYFIHIVRHIVVPTIHWLVNTRRTGDLDSDRHRHRQQQSSSTTTTTTTTTGTTYVRTPIRRDVKTIKKIQYPFTCRYNSSPVVNNFLDG